MYAGAEPGVQIWGSEKYALQIYDKKYIPSDNNFSHKITKYKFDAKKLL
jgi:hypothetical protein